MQFDLTINLDNAAFEDNENELCDILVKVANYFANTPVSHLRENDRKTLFDSNGNKIGDWYIGV